VRTVALTSLPLARSVDRVGVVVRTGDVVTGAVETSVGTETAALANKRFPPDNLGTGLGAGITRLRTFCGFWRELSKGFVWICVRVLRWTGGLSTKKTLDGAGSFKVGTALFPGVRFEVEFDTV